MQHWLDLAKSIIKQIKGSLFEIKISTNCNKKMKFIPTDVDPVLFTFRVKFYPADPFRLQGNGKLMLYQQLKRDLRHGRLYCSVGESGALGALIVQGLFNFFVRFFDEVISISELEHNTTEFFFFLSSILTIVR